MTTLTKIKADAVAQQLKDGGALLIDIREADEHRREHVAGSLSLPLSALDQGALTLEAGQKAVFHCRSGARTETNCARLASHVEGEAFVLDGGLEAWKAAGLPTVQDKSAPLEINRQVQITAGSIVLSGVLLGAFVNPGFFALSGFVGAGLIFAGVSGWCGMAKLLGAMPWNRPRQAA